MQTLPFKAPEFIPGKWYTLERKVEFPANPEGFLWPEEEKMVHHLMKMQEDSFAWTKEEKGKFQSEYFDPVVIPMIEHVPCVLRNMHILPRIYKQVVKVIKEKIQAGVYKPSNSSY